jgi:histidinol-phosphate/aromatic aminotransferase/cobyric acid decarboxylase-like protein
MLWKERGLIKRNPHTMFLIDEAFIEFGGKSGADLIFEYKEL